MKQYKIVPAENVPLDRDQAFTYVAPDDLAMGDLVEIPLGRRKVLGVVTEPDEVNHPYKIRPIERIVAKSYLTQQQIDLVFWIGKYYHASLGLVLRLFLTGYDEKLLEEPAPQTVTQPSASTLVPTDAQKSAMRTITQALRVNRFAEFLLFGVTGSGKTEVYLRACAENQRQGRQTLIMIPEIALTPQARQRFELAFGNHVYVYHSKLTPKEKRQVVAAVRHDLCAVVLGPRSALFLPLHHLGLVVVDEEHDQSYKQFDKTPRYDARMVARRLCRLLKIPLVYGDATPRIETYARTQSNRSTLLHLPRRTNEREGKTTLPSVSVVDFVQELKNQNTLPLSQKMIDELTATLNQKEQALLFLNRRGFASSVLCVACQSIIMCKRCSVPLVLHEKTMVCHQCGHTEPLPSVCPSCSSQSLKAQGVGTIQIEKIVRSLFPHARVARIDGDTMKHQDDYTNLYESLKNHTIDVVIGTQMIARGLDIPNVSFVGVIQTDSAMNLPDFRSEEQVYQLISQVSGRAGRGDKPGRVVIQTFFPEHPVFKFIQKHDYESFFAYEFAKRQLYNNPPATHMALLTIEHSDSAKAQAEANSLATALQKEVGVEVLGPSPCFIMQRRGKWRWQIILKAKSHAKLPLDKIPASWHVDVDPQSLV